MAFQLGAAVCLPPAPALAANSCWFGAPASPPSVLPSCSDPAFSFELINRFYLNILKLPTQGAGTIDFALTNSSEIMVVDVNFIPPLEIQGSSPPLSGEFNYQISIDPFDTDYFASASLSITPPPADPPADPAAIMLVQQIPEANESLDAGNHSWVSLYRKPDSLKSIKLLRNFTLNSGSLASIHNGFEIFVYAPPKQCLPRFPSAALPWPSATAVVSVVFSISGGGAGSRQLGSAPAPQASPQTVAEGLWCPRASG